MPRTPPPPTADTPRDVPASARPAEPKVGSADSGIDSRWPGTGPAPEPSGLSGYGAVASGGASHDTARFDVCHPALALRAVVLVQAALAVAAVAGAAGPADWLARQAVLAFGGAFATLLWLVALCALQRHGRRSKGPEGARVVVATALGALAAWVPWWALGWAGLVGGGAWQGLGVALGGALVAAVLSAWLGLRARAWQPVDTRVRLAELQSRIRPHFLFNTLNSAVALVRADPERAERVLEDLAELFRGALADVDAADASVTLAEELELARRYLEIEALRFGPRLVVHWALEDRAGEARVPPLVLQPLVENAVRHGVEPTPAGGTLWVRTRRRHGQVELTVSNTLGREPGVAGQGLALANVRERLRLLHDVAAQFDTWQESRDPLQREGAVFHARILLPAP